MHMPGQTDDVRLPRMEEWLGKIQNEEKWAVELWELGLEKEIGEFWKRLGEKDKGAREARKVDQAKKKGQKEVKMSRKQVENGEKVEKGKTEQKTEAEKGKKEPKLTRRPGSVSYNTT